ncbi:GGDEF domain-containing protein [Actinoplanes sp. NPDC051851]|uniref:sensor domain-containing diguanylate cyclase n=1 Tax=Actinoplanes sp. NPDC051851 TaxID=3154753 RepID=UPI003425A55D
MLLGEVERLVADSYESHHGLPERAAELIDRAEALGDRRSADLARLVRAELDNRSGRVPEAVAVARALLGASDDRLIRAHAHAVIAGGLWRIGDNANAVRHSLWSMRMLLPEDPPAIRADHAIILAVQVNDQRMGDFEWVEFAAAQREAEASGMPSLEIANLNNWAWCSYEAGDMATAGTMLGRMRERAASAGQVLNTSCADTVARVLLETGEPAEAERVILDAIENTASTDSDAVPGALLTLAEIEQRRGDFAGAIRTLERCRALAAERDLPETDAEALRMVSVCQAGAGDFEAAYRSMVEFHEAWEARRSQQSDLAARFAHAQFAVEEAYRDTERFREMAERDPLTGLGNRRRSEADLVAAVAAGGPVCLAILDLDHFKKVNDTFSHAAGDEVLRRVAALMNEVPGFAGRLGGEEFILVFRAGLDEAARHCEQFRVAVEGYPWSEVAEGLAVTTSVGVTGVRPGEDRKDATLRADDLLYAAKRGGRNRVVSGG